MIYKGTDLLNEHWLYSDFKIVVFGGTGGIGKRLIKFIGNNYDVASLGSKDVDLLDAIKVKNFIEGNEPDVIINLSGVNHNSFLHKYTNYSDIDNLIGVNIYGNIHILTNALPIMREKGYGRIILASSVLAHKTVLGTSIYSASKSFLDTLVRVAAAENAFKGITINTLRMGYFDAGLTYTLPENIRRIIKENIPAGSFGNIADLWGIIECLFENEYINGANIDINGGLNGL